MPAVTWRLAHRWVLGLVASIGLVFAANATGIAPAGQVPKLQADIQLDGELNEPQWQQALAISLPYLTWPQDNLPAPVNTQAWIFEDGQAIYIAFRAQDPAVQKIAAHYRDHDKLSGEDSVGVVIDTYNRQQQTYNFNVNPLGSREDYIRHEQTDDDRYEWDGFWDAAGKRTEFGYVVEMKIPYGILNFDDSQQTQQWAIEFIRKYPREANYRLSSVAINHDNVCWICQLPVYQGFAGAEQGHNTVLATSLVTGVDQTRGLAESPWQTERDTKLSADLKWSLSSDITLNATLNPDFSQVEADASQLSVNNPDVLYYAEKRPFFTENSSAFSSTQPLIYTRNINAPDAGAKLTGKARQHNFAGFWATEDSAKILVPGNLGSYFQTLNQRAQNFAGRYGYNLANEASVGAVLTQRQAGDYRSSLLALDGFYRSSDSDYWDVQLLSSTSSLPSDLAQQLCLADDCSAAALADCSEASGCGFDELVLRNMSESLSGQAAYLAYEHEDRHWLYGVNYTERDPEFRADLGFMPLVDIKQWQANGRYRFYAPDEQSWWQQFDIEVDGTARDNSAGERLRRDAAVTLNVSGAYRSALSVSLLDRHRVAARQDNRSLSVANAQWLHEQLWYGWFSTRPLPGLYVLATVSYGDRIDYSADRIADNLMASLALELSVTEQWQLQLNYQFDNMDFAGAKVYREALWDIRNTYQFNARSFLRWSLLYSRYTSYRQGPEGEQFNDLHTELLYSYKLNPQTVFFLGYNDGAVQWQNEQQPLTGLRKTERSVFMKLGYAWQL